MATYTVNCYPDCSKKFIRENITNANPCIDISIIRTEALLQFQNGNIVDADKALDKLISTYQTATSAKGKEKNSGFAALSDSAALKNLGQSSNLIATGGIGQADNFGRFSDLYGFLSLMSGALTDSFINIPIFSSPNISVSHGNGFENEQSLFSFIQSIINSGSKFFGGAAGLIGGITSALEWLTGLAGVSPRLSPYFSFKANPFSATPSLSIETKLINDSMQHVKDNNLFLKSVIKDTLIRSSTYDSTGAATTGSILNSWIPPKLFNVSLRFGVGGSIVKRFLLCKLTSSITPEGLMRIKNGMSFPDAYSISLNFQSILPETGDTWADANAWGNDGSIKTSEQMTQELDKAKGEEVIRIINSMAGKTVLADNDSRAEFDSQFNTAIAYANSISDAALREYYMNRVMGRMHEYYGKYEVERRKNNQRLAAGSSHYAYNPQTGNLERTL